MPVERRGITPSVWLSFALGALGFAMAKSALAEWLSPESIAVLFWTLILLSALSLVAAVREYYIREGIDIAEAYHSALDPNSLAVPAPPKPSTVSLPVTPTVPPRVVFVGSRYIFVKRAYGTFEEDGDATPPYGAALVANFELDPELYGKTIDVDAAQGRITYSQNGSICERVAYGCWLTETDRHVSFGVGDIRSLLLVVRDEGYPIAIDCTGENAEGGNKFTGRQLGFEDYEVEVTVLLKDGNYQHLASSVFTYALHLRDSSGKPTLQLTLNASATA
jgi:hypothetical protein